MGYQKVESSSPGGRAEPHISLRKSGSIGINNACLEEYFEEDEEFVFVYYDEENNKLAFRPLEEKENGSYKLSRTESGGSVAPSSFLKANKLVPNITTQYEPFTDSINGDTKVIAIDLDNPSKTYGEPDEDEPEEQVEA